MLHYNVCGCEDGTQFQGREVTINKMCYDCMKQYIGQEIEFLRFGQAPEDGVSYNYAENCWEAGMSAYMIFDGKLANVVRGEFEGRTIYIGKGTMADTGGDGEPVVVNFEMKKATKKQIKFLGL